MFCQFKPTTGSTSALMKHLAKATLVGKPINSQYRQRFRSREDLQAVIEPIEEEEEKELSDPS